jgi:hypothetical protein
VFLRGDREGREAQQQGSGQCGEAGYVEHFVCALRSGFTFGEQVSVHGARKGSQSAASVATGVMPTEGRR